MICYKQKVCKKKQKEKNFLLINLTTKNKKSHWITLITCNAKTNHNSIFAAKPGLLKSLTFTLLQKEHFQKLHSGENS